jgi:hypothetical protein
MYYIIYSSQESSPLSNEMLKNILDTSIIRNRACKVTGLLVRIDNRFIQLLEGDKKNVNEIYASIEKDKRHHQVVKVLSGNYSKRLFCDWSMAFANVTKEDFATISGGKRLEQIEELQNTSEDIHPTLLLMNHFNKRYQRD